MPSNKRQRELARRRAERQAARRAAERAARRKRRTILGLSIGGLALGIVLLLVLVSVLKDDKKKDSDVTATPTPSAAVTPSGPCQITPDSSPTGGKKPGNFPDPAFSKTTLKGTLTLNKGTVEFDMFADKAPCTVASFQHLASKKYFDGGKCHRQTNTPSLVVLQCGDPTGSGQGGPGYAFKDENLPKAGPDGTASYPRGTVAMANSGPASNGSQFFLVMKDSKLPPNYTVFGKVTKGLEVLDALVAAGVKGGGDDGAPKDDVTIKSFRVA